MGDRIEVIGARGPIRITVSDELPVRVGIATGPVAVRVQGQPGPQGQVGPQGPQGAPGAAASLSSDANNTAQLGADGGIYVPSPQFASAQW